MTATNLMLTEKMTEPERTERVQLILLPPKRNRFLRFCVDYLKFNSVVTYSSYPLQSGTIASTA